MTDRLIGTLRRIFTLAALCAACASVAGAPQPAQARVWVGFGFPLVVAPPVNYNPPLQYSASDQFCFVACTTVCPTEHVVASGPSRDCTTLQVGEWGWAT